MIDSEANPDHLSPEEKEFVLDLRAQIRRKEGGKLLPTETVNVEMQSYPQSYFTDRLLAYASRLYIRQIRPGPDGYKNLFPVYSLAFCSNNLREFSSIPDRHYHLCTIRREDSDPSRQPLFSRGIQFVVVELAKFTKQTGDLLDLRDAWCYLLKEAPNMSGAEFDAIRNKGKEMGNAVKKLWELSEEDHVQIRIEAREKQRMDQMAREQYQWEEGERKGREEGKREGERKGREEGKREGERKGREEGKREGERKGREEGKREGQKEGERKGREERDKEVALQMLAKNLDIATICECTGLTKKEVEALKPRKKQS